MNINLTLNNEKKHFNDLISLFNFLKTTNNDFNKLEGFINNYDNLYIIDNIDINKQSNTDFKFNFSIIK